MYESRANNNMKPLLSICIPTYNRADLLRGCLECLAAEIAPFGDEVELIVSDNCSTDHTPEVVEQMSKKTKIRYNRNNVNLGAVGNIKILVEQLATGEFCWLIGDDDIPREGAIRKVLALICDKPELDLFLLNVIFMSRSKRPQAISNRGGDAGISDIFRQCFWQKDAYLSRGEDAFNFTNQPDLFTCMPSLVFRRLKGHLPVLTCKEAHSHGSFEVVYPHVVGVSHLIVGRPIFFVGSPCVFVGFGTQEWFDDWASYYWFNYVPLIADLFEKLGATKRIVDRQRKLYLRNALVGRYWFSLMKRSQNRMPREFSIVVFIAKYWHYPQFWLMATGLYAVGRWLRSNLHKLRMTFVH